MSCLPSLTLSSLRVLLGYAVTAGSRNSREGPPAISDIMRNNTQHCVLRMSDSSVYKRETEGSAVRVEYESVFMRFHNQFAVSYRPKLRRLLL
jgi:hypothetical protein